MSRSFFWLATLAAFGCAAEVKQTAVLIDDSGGIEATLPDGTVVGSYEEYEEAIQGQVGPIEEMQPMALSVSTKTDGGAPGIAIGKFTIRIAPDSSYLEGCIRKKFFHLKIVVEAAGAEFIELHLLAFFENNKPCFAVMNTGFVGYGWCAKYCVANPKDSIKAGLKDGLKTAGLSAATAAVAAILIAPIASVALAPAAL